MGMFYKRFFLVDDSLKFKRLKVLCMSFYVSKLWLDKLGSLKAPEVFVVTCLYAFMKLLGLPKRINNHLVCNELGVLTFEQYY